MKILFLHLSDLHLTATSDVNTLCVREIAGALGPNSIGSVDKILLLVTGDLAFSGKSEQYVAFHSLIDSLLPALQEKTSVNDISIYVVPGKYSLQGTTQGRYLTGGVPPVRFSM